MGRGSDRLRVPLSQRGRAQPLPPTLSDVRPCWVSVPGGRSAGTVHAWRKDPESGAWQALVVCWLPSAAVEPRDADDPTAATER